MERLTGIEPATFSLGSGMPGGVKGESSAGCENADCRCCNARCNGAELGSPATVDPEVAATLTALTTLDAAERARVLAHVAALVGMSQKRRNAILTLGEGQ
ncbi:MAG: hypothetical protein IPH13_01185 [Planctomycetes bacterium]|nr:hypothetical protein [Planctomycetota bacterium]